LNLLNTGIYAMQYLFFSVSRFDEKINSQTLL
jgi:hypothetical protein